MGVLDRGHIFWPGPRFYLFFCVSIWGWFTKIVTSIALAALLLFLILLLLHLLLLQPLTPLILLLLLPPQEWTGWPEDSNDELSLLQISLPNPHTLNVNQVATGLLLPPATGWLAATFLLLCPCFCYLAPTPDPPARQHRLLLPPHHARRHCEQWCGGLRWWLPRWGGG